MRTAKDAAPGLGLSPGETQTTQRKVAGLGIKPSTCVWVVHKKKAEPETLSSSLMKATFPLAVILSRPDQSGVSSFQSAALLYSKESKQSQLWNHKNNMVVNYCGFYLFCFRRCIPMQMYSAREFVQPATDWPSERWALAQRELLIKTVQLILPLQSLCRWVTIFSVNSGVHVLLT